MQLKKSPQHKRNTISNFFRFLSAGNFSEILTIIIRRALSTLRFIEQFTIGIYFNAPIVKMRRQKKRLNKILVECFGYIAQDDSAGKIKVALIVREGTSHPRSSAFIRLISPLTDDFMKAKVHIVLFSENTIQIPSDVNVCVVQRTAYDEENTAIQLVNNLREQNIKLIVDNDDAFSAIDPSHPEHTEQKNRVGALNYLLSEADRVWLSVAKLKNHLPKLHRPAVIVENSLDPRLWKTENPQKNFNKLSVNPLQLLYMGTVSHDADLEMILPALENVAKENPGSFRLTVIGVASDLPDYRWIKRLHQKRGASIYPMFVRWFVDQGPFDIGLSPLVENEFNNSKSDIKCLDYLAVGILPMVSDVEPYQSKELDKFIIKIQNTQTAWEKALTSAVKDPEAFRKRNAIILPKAQKYLWEKRSSTATAKNILDQLRSLAR